ncbi:MAG: hypothetical protein D6820_09660 [Lentisphaerae bacterium]|nr:MAG: hypothetical protein D6820_09660 [Lentisphaerota bacterium]
MMKKLTVEEEAHYIAQICDGEFARELEFLKDCFNLLHNRAQLLLSLITLCLTITGFSGPRIAASSAPARYCLIAGIILVLIAAVILVLGPLQIRWITATRSGDETQTIIELLRRRNWRTRLFVIGADVLLLGLSFYVCAVVIFFAFVPGGNAS